MNEQNATQVIRRALVEIKRLKRELNTQTYTQPIAIIGMSCRLPGGSYSPETYWDLLKNGREGLCDVPENRWDSKKYYDEDPGKPAKIYTQKLNFLAEGVSLFDPRLFVISPREAQEMDPQQRLLLELSWEALERAGYAPKSLKGQSVGVFMGIITAEYALLPRDLDTTGPHTMTGLLNSMASGRIAHAFGFHGPALSIDTACSSSMVSIHQACKSIQDKECDTAIAGGAGIMLSPLPMLNLCKLHALAKDGRCKTFSALGDGYGRGEGAGVVVLKRLDLAQKDGDPILAVIEASNINHDGHSSGLTVPNGKAQQQLLEQTLSRANIPPRDIGYVELHGTGTSLGDPIEFQSLVGVFGKDRSPDKPLMLGTCKANIGHLEAAAGIASVIKTVLCLKNKAVPPHINCDEINPRIQLHRIPAILPDSYQNWETQDNEIRRVGISSFGFSGTNAFMVIKEAPVLEHKSSELSQDRDKHILTITAQSKSALNELVMRYKKYVADPTVTDLASFAYTINVARSHFSWRAACVWSDKEELIRGLSSVGSEKDSNSNTYYLAATVDSEKKITIIFPGKLSGSITQLASVIASCSQFSKTYLQCETCFAAYTSSSLRQLLTMPTEHFASNTLDQAAIVFSVSYSFYKLFHHLGIKIGTVYAEGEGVYSMAASTGLVSLEQAIMGLINRYSDIGSNETTPQYKFTMPQLRVILPGNSDPLKRSQLSDPTLLECAYGGTFDKETLLKLFGEETLMFELDTTPEMTGRIYTDKSSCLSTYLSSLSWDGIINFVAECYSRGHNIKWNLFDQGFQRKKLDCPTYPFQRRSYWIKSSTKILPSEQLVSQQTIETTTANPFEGRILSSPLQETMVVFNIGPKSIPSLTDTHNIVHIGHFFEMLTSGLKKLEKQHNHIQFLSFDFVLIVAEREDKDIHLILKSLGDSTQFSFHAQGKHAEDWSQHVHGVMVELPPHNKEPEKHNFDSIKSRCINEMSGDKFYLNMEKKGVVLGTSVQWLDQIWYRNGEALSKFRIATTEEAPNSYELRMHPGVWASCFQLLHSTLDDTVHTDVRFVLVGMRELDIFETEHTSTLWCHVTSLGHPDENGILDGKFTLYTDTGCVVAHCHGCEMKEQAVEKESDIVCEGDPEIVSVLDNAESIDHQLELIIGYIKEILCELLKVLDDEIGVSESINQLGMDSLVGFELRDKINKQFGTPVPIATLLTGPTPKELAQAIQKDFVNSRKNATVDVGCHSEKDKESNTITIPAYSEISMDKAKWLQRDSTDSTGIRLYCLPYGGGSASVYKTWQSAFSDDISVIPIQLPGRQDRIHERPIESMQEMVETLTEVLGNDLNQPYALYGHSAGALVAYAWAQYLSDTANPIPEHLIVGGFTAPYISSPYLGVVKKTFIDNGFAGIPSVDEFVQQAKLFPTKIKKCMAKISDATGIDLHASFDNQEFSDVIMPLLVADSKLVSSFNPNNTNRLEIPIAALHGTDDDRVPILGMRAWKSLTSKSFSVKTFSGDHFFLHADQSEQKVIDHISDLLIIQHQEVV